MEAETLGIMIPIIALMIPFFAIWTHHRRKIEKMRADATVQTTAEKAAQYASRVQELEDRVQVLERIVTDRGYDVATQIEALRDSREVEQQNSNVGIPLDISKKETV